MLLIQKDMGPEMQNPVSPIPIDRFQSLYITSTS